MIDQIPEEPLKNVISSRNCSRKYVFQRLPKGSRKIVTLTAYDFSMAKIFTEAGVDILLVGDSLGMVVLGYPDTHSVTLEDMIRHGRAVVRGRDAAISKIQQGNALQNSPLVVIDMPIGACDTPDLAVKHCRLVCKETLADAVKIEGSVESVRAVVRSGISVMAHTGLKPQFMNKFIVQGVKKDDANALFFESKELEKAGAFSIVLECIPRRLGARITRSLHIPTIGIGAGPDTDGQVLVSNDILGLYDGIRPRFVRQYVDLASQIRSAAERYIDDVRMLNYPRDDESYE